MAPTSLRLHVVWTEESPAGRPELAGHGNPSGGRATEFGMQRGRSEVLAGEPQPDGTTLFTTSVELYVDKAGRQRFRGECVQGPPEEPFLYLSWRIPGQASWIMRSKVLLTSLTPEVLNGLPDAAELRTSVSRMGHRPAGHVQEWTPL